MTADSWWQDEFGLIELGDARLNKRLIKVAEQFSAQPTQPINQACEDWVDTKAAYRLFQNEKVNANEIIRVHAMRTRDRAKSYPLIIAATDKSFINFDGHLKTTGLGNIGTNQKHTTQGLIMHTTIGVTPQGMPIGLLNQKIWARKELSDDRKKKIASLNIEEKESYSWLQGLKQTVELMSGLNTQVVTVADREADIYEFIVLANELNASYVVRASWDRALGSKKDPMGYLWEHMEKQTRAGVIKIEVPARGTKEPARTAKAEIYFSKVDIRRPDKDRFTSKSSIPESTPVDVVWVKEINAPENVIELEWMLFTNVVVDNFDSALERVSWYKLRWTIEVFHKVLKSGCKVEDCRLQTGERLTRYLALFSIIAWRIHWMTHMNRVSPEDPCDKILAQHEWQALYCKIHKTNKPSQKPPTNSDAIRWIASLGGFLGRKGDLQPGIISIWRGWQRLNDISDDFLLFKKQKSYG